MSLDPETFRLTAGRVRYLLRAHPEGHDLAVFATTSDDVAIVAELSASDLRQLACAFMAQRQQLYQAQAEHPGHPGPETRPPRLLVSLQPEEESQQTAKTTPKGRSVTP